MAACWTLPCRNCRPRPEDQPGNWLPAETAKLYQDAGRYDMAFASLKRAVPNYFAMDFSSLPRSYWEALFPKPYWTDLKKFSSANGLDPYLVASLIRQESEFNPDACREECRRADAAAAQSRPEGRPAGEAAAFLLRPVASLPA